MLNFNWLTPRRRRADSGPARERIEPTLPPIDGRVRIRLRYNDRMACAVTDNEAALHGMGVADSWRDTMGAAPSREVVVEVPLPHFADPAPAFIRADPLPDSAPIAAATPSAVVSTPPPTPDVAPARLPAPAARIQPTYSPAEHASRLLAWCRRAGITGELTIDDILAAYSRMCRDEGLPPRPWNPVSREFTVLVAGRVGVKTYANRGNVKVRVFRVPSAPARQAPAELERAAA